MSVSNYKSGEELPVVEEFYSLQGEGYHTGKAAYFIRIGGCDICCSWCDVKISWNAEASPLVKVDDIISRILFHKAFSVVITGGEPMLYNLDYLCGELKKHNIEIFLETSGASEISGKWDWICLSPKKKSPPLNVFYSLANELKVVVDEKLDFEWAEYNANLVSEKCLLYLQPEWSVYKKVIHPLVEYVKISPRWAISLQSHKFMKIP